MTLRTICLAFFLTAVAGLGAPAAIAQTAPTGNGKQAISIGDSLRRPEKVPAHILYIHGIGATGSDDSLELRKSLCKRVGVCDKKTWGEYRGREYADEEIFDLKHAVPSVDYMGEPMWKTPEEWHAAAPFVDHYVIKLKSGKSLLVDELNWWPMMFAVKCRHMMPNETNLAGRSNDYFSLCATRTAHAGDPNRFDFYNWIDFAEVNALNAKPNPGVLANRLLKVNLMDWRFSDALLGVGPLEAYLVEGVRQLVMKCVKTGSVTTGALTSSAPSLLDPNAEFITISHSLGSFLIFSALHEEYRAAGPTFATDNAERTTIFNYLLGHLTQAYFFANQIPLLELAKLGSANEKTFLDLRAWVKQRSDKLGAQRDASVPLAQIVSWSDPNDLLTWYLGEDFQHWQSPDGSVRVVNNPVHNAFHWFWVFENPSAAHDNYAKNPRVIRTLLEPLQP